MNIFKAEFFTEIGACHTIAVVIVEAHNAPGRKTGYAIGWVLSQFSSEAI
jgi:hypothetical protein